MNRVLVAMSGNLMSSVVAALLKHQGYQVNGLHLKLSADSEKIEKLAEQLGVHLTVLDVRDEWQHRVRDHIIHRLISVKPLEPELQMNQLLIEKLAQKALELKCQNIATGHFARVALDPSTQATRLLRGQEFDQSYLLHGVSADLLKRFILPVGDLSRSAIEKLAVEIGLTPTAYFTGGSAANLNLPTSSPQSVSNSRPRALDVSSTGSEYGQERSASSSPNSQPSSDLSHQVRQVGRVGRVGYGSGFGGLSEEDCISLAEGSVPPDLKRGGAIKLNDCSLVGDHAGTFRHPIGKMVSDIKGISHLKIKPEGLLIRSIETSDQTIGLGMPDDFEVGSVVAENAKWNQFIDGLRLIKCQARLVFEGTDHGLGSMNGQNPVPTFDCQVTPFENELLYIEFTKPQRVLGPGQSIVFYRQDEVLGGAVLCPTRT